LNFLTQLRDKTEKEGIEELKEMGIGEKMAKKMMSMVKEEGMTRRIERMKEGKLGFFPRRVWDKIVEKERIKSADSPDQPVTADIKRLIRMPTSLHAKSGLEAKPLKIDQLKDFNPLEDAVVFGDAPIKINAISSSAIKMKGEAYKVEKEEKVSLPEHVALYFMCRGVAEII
jgi:DNA primase small subunit